jgi:hypothetical protein
MGALSRSAPVSRNNRCLRHFREKSDLFNRLGEFVLWDLAFALEDGEGLGNPFKTEKVVSKHSLVPHVPPLPALPICSNLDFENRSLCNTIHKNLVLRRLLSETNARCTRGVHPRLIQCQIRSIAGRILLLCMFASGSRRGLACRQRWSASWL